MLSKVKNGISFNELAPYLSSSQYIFLQNYTWSLHDPSTLQCVYRKQWEYNSSIKSADFSWFDFALSVITSNTITQISLIWTIRPCGLFLNRNRVVIKCLIDTATWIYYLKFNKRNTSSFCFSLNLLFMWKV